MRHLAAAVLLVATGCAGSTGPSGEATTTRPPATTASTSPASPETTPAPALGDSPTYTVGDCATPPVTFALLCDVVDLLQEHHVDHPLDMPSLAAGASVGAGSYRPAHDAAAPESFECAIPDEAFVSTCAAIADHLTAGGFPVEEAVEAAVASMVELSLDPFTYYLPPELSGALTEDGIVAAVGMLVTIVDPVGSACAVAAGTCRVEVTFAVEDGPAAEAGLEAGDVISAIGSETVDGLGLVDIAARLDGPAGSTVTVTATDDEGTSEELTVQRQQLAVPELEVAVPSPGVGYLRVPDFEADVPRWVHEALAELLATGVAEIVIDLRDNPGGLVDAATIVASEFLTDGLVLRTNGPAEVLDYPVLPGGLATSDVDLTVVVNGGSASAAEVVAGVLAERDRATIVGTPTFGKDTVQIGFPLRNDGRLRVTVARWTTPEGASVAVTGITPDVAVDIPPDATPADVVDLVIG